MYIKKIKNNNESITGNILELCNTLIVCLGNPGMENTRHNVGADMMKLLIKDYSKKEIDKNLYLVFFPQSSTCQGFCSLVYLIPSVMNDSGKNVMKFYKKLNCKNLVVISDNLEKPIGNISPSFGTSAKGHNGIRSIIQYFGSNEFWNIKIGIGRPETEAVHDFVLGKFTLEEKNAIILLLDSFRLVMEKVWILILEKKQIKG